MCRCGRGWKTYIIKWGGGKIIKLRENIKIAVEGIRKLRENIKIVEEGIEE